MTTQTYTSVLDHTSDAGFRAWGAELGVNLALAGLVQTADTGQINWVTVTRPAINTSGGYEIWRFADSTIYLKIEYGTAGGAAAPQMWITAGTGSNGSGTLTGQLSTRTIWTAGAAAASTITTYTTYISRTADALSICWKATSISTAYPSGYVVVGKTVDSSGAATNVGYGVILPIGGVPQMQSVRIAATAATYNQSFTFTMVVGNPAVSTVGADIQTYMCWVNVPQVLPFAFAVAYVQVEVTKLNTFSVAMVGSVSHTYLAMGQLGGSSTINGQSANAYSLAFIYE